MQRALNLVLAAWAGSLWTVCGIVAPSLFAVLPDRHLAGQVAGYFFRLEAWLGVALGSIVLFLLARRAAPSTRFDYGLLSATMLAPVASELGLRPWMEAARAAEDMHRFGMLHGVSALLFIVACIAALLLVWRLSAPTTAVGARAD
jgi:hypothetical protein